MVAGTPADDSAPALRRSLGFWEVTASGVGIIVGAGIYVLLGAATAEAGAAVWLAFVAAATLSALTGLSYAELAAMYPRASAEFEYARHAFPAWVAFLVGWVMITALVVAAATVALGFARYLGEFVPVGDRTGALLLLALVTAISMAGIKNSTRLAVALALIQVGGLLFVIAVGFPHVGDRALTGGNGVGGVLAAAALVFFAFLGFDEVITLSEETRDPSRTIPRALLTALGISTVLYILVAIVAVSVLGAAALGASERPLADVIAEALGGRSVDLVAALALAATANTTLLAITAASRLTYGMASSGVLPGRLARVSPRTGAPRYAIAVCAVVAVAFALLDRLPLIASVTDFAVYLVFLAVNASVVVLRVREPALDRPFRTPGRIGRIPVLPVLGFASTLLMLTQLEARSITIGLGVVVLGTVASFGFGRRRRLKRSAAD